ncbi:E3 ubiquitin-protein ligase MARCHF5-like [Macrosteles quadrilineatus]|uniref:E3 ubiquitin-protein ligase MARCHF5-like n=1 Tax=Macrosteles quadrilineatus TaxID=74068 RepID=UPI0023E1E379|nr:E3 ubiquitin-protein ligase MARCHF5-like [Macrosteles quadrilineatus]XP_054262658.1 E3 ubiquitin-protein ligase MARCHF5-like [Macrosteles quadrilineatus]
MAVSPAPLSHISVEDNDRTCWICFATDEDGPAFKWVHPCGCKGSGKWVHESCLLLWVDEKKKDFFSAKLACPQCKVEFVIISPKPDVLMKLMQTMDRFVEVVCPISTALASVWMICWSASGYGAFTIMQIFGEEEGLCLLESVEPLILLVLLPCIPTSLIFMKMIPWEHYLLAFLRRRSNLPLLKHILPSVVYHNVNGRMVPIEPEGIKREYTRIFVEALALPTIAKLVGDLLFHKEKSCLKRCLLGGLTFVTIKGVLSMYNSHRTYVQRSQRRVENKCL